MAEKKRFRIGNTTINLGLENLADIMCLYPTNACKNYTYIDCLYTNHFCGYRIPTTPPIACDPYTPHFTTTNITTGCGYPTVFTPPTGGGCGRNFSTGPITKTTIFENGTIIHGRTIREMPPVELHDIKENLLTQLKAIEEQEEEMKKSEAPQTREELDLLESELEKTLKEVKNLKKEMK